MKKNFIGNSKNVVWALLIVAAAVTVYGIAQAATVSHTPEQITPQGPGSGFDSDTLWGLTSADILAEGGGATGGSGAYYTTCGLKVASTCDCYSTPTTTCDPPQCAPGDISVATGCAYNAYDTVTTANCGGECYFYRGFVGYCQRTCKTTQSTSGGVAAGSAIIYATKNTYNGNLGGRNGADAKCAAELPPELSGKVTNIHAFLSVSSTDEIIDMHSSDSDNDGTALGYYETANPIYAYNRYWAEWTLLASNWRDLLDGTISSSLSTASFPTYYWTGSSTYGAYVANYNCNGWTASNYENGYYGSGSHSTAPWLRYSSQYCNSKLALVCAAKYTG